VERTAGVPRVDGAPMGSSGTLRVGEWVETDDSSQAVIAVGTIGHVDVRPGSRVRLVRARDTDHRLALAYGSIHAKVDAPPRIFFVETPAGTAIDLGCEYTLETDRTGRGLIHVTGGTVEFAAGGTRSIVPLGAYAMTRPGQAPGIPYLEDAPAALRAALASFDFEQGGAAAARQALVSARAEDALSLWHLLTRVDAALRGEVYDRLAALVPPPAGVTREGALTQDPATLEHYWSLIRRIEFRRIILKGIRDIDPRTGVAR
jgi:FecR-like protein